MSEITIDMSELRHITDAVIEIDDKIREQFAVREGSLTLSWEGADQEFEVTIAFHRTGEPMVTIRPVVVAVAVDRG